MADLPHQERNPSKPRATEDPFGLPATLDYGDWIGEYRALTETVGCAHDVEHGYLELTGPDRAGFLNRLATNRLDNLSAGQGCETFLTDARGRIQAWIQVIARPERLLLRMPRDQVGRIAIHLGHYLIHEKVEVVPRTGQLAGILLAGPQTGELLHRIAALDVPHDYLSSAEAAMGGVRVQVHTLCSTPPAVAMTCAMEDLAMAWQVIRAAGAMACGQRAAEVLRIESGWPRYGQDITDDNLPQEIARDSLAISFTKGCYLGQETVARIDSRGHVNRFLVGLVLPGNEAPPAGTELTTRGGAVVGRVTSGAWSPRFEAGVALGYVRRGHHAPDTELISPSGPARVTELPM